VKTRSLRDGSPDAPAVEAFLQRWGLALLVLFAVLYYEAYYNTALLLTGESGSNALIASRIIEGWRPIADMFVGYNLLWFYPIAALFKITGPHMLAMQIFFMCLCLVTSTLGFLLVKKTTGQAWLAMLAGGLMILMPGAMFRNYMGFIGTLASFALVFGYVIPASNSLRQCLWMGFCGAALSLCFLIRIEPSLLILVVWIGLAILYPIGICGEFLRRSRVVVIGTLLALIAFAAVHIPFVLHARERGFEREFLNQYGQFFDLFRWELQKELQKSRGAIRLDWPPYSGSEILRAGLPSPVVTVTNAQRDSDDTGRDGRRSRPDLSEAFHGKGSLFFALSIYLPVLTSAVLALSGALLAIFGMLKGNERARFLGLLVLATTGAALSLFPQYFFFRPDSVHLAEFMVPFYPALACAAFAGWWVFRNLSSLIGRLFGVALPILCGFQVVGAFNALYGREGSGSIRLARGRTVMFHAPGGIDFRVKPAELRDWEGLRDALLTQSRPGDYLVTYPYVPLLNIMAQRPSYQSKLYVDNATESPDFPQKAIIEFEKNKPAVVVVNNRDINRTEVSRFRNWAAPFYQHVSSKYVLTGTYLKTIEVFVRPDRVEPVKDDSPKNDFRSSGLLSFRRGWPRRETKTEVFLLNCRSVFGNRRATAEDMAVAVHIVDAGDAGPELVLAEPWRGPSGL
jgi:hypothetical protein